MKARILALLAIGLVAVLSGCTTHTQTTSGEAYLARYGLDSPSPVVATAIDSSRTGQDATAAEPSAGFDLEGAIREAARVEPRLQFPARVGIARIGPYGLSAIPEEEAQAWLSVAEELGPSFGEFVPVSPLVANLVVASLNVGKDERVFNVVNQIRLAAARQHLDAVLMYEAVAHSQTATNALAFTDWTIVGAFMLPSRNVDAVATAHGVLIDVLQGYPYATIQTSVEDHEFSTAWGRDDRRSELADRVKSEATVKLGSEVADMFKRLRQELAERS
ncbi:MAG: hypothetical protein ACR2RL_09080 [Gammaproteobacteria bacterium]